MRCSSVLYIIQNAVRMRHSCTRYTGHPQVPTQNQAHRHYTQGGWENPLSMELYKRHEAREKHKRSGIDITERKRRRNRYLAPKRNHEISVRLSS